MAEEIKKFPLSHTTLYCKCWYEASSNPFDDIRKTLTADGYSGEYFSDKDIIHLLLGKMDEYFPVFRKNYNPIGFFDMYDYINKFDWLYEKDKDKPLEFKIWRWIRSRIFDLNKEDFVAVEPDYTILPRMRWYPKEWVERRLFPIFESWCYEYEFNDIKSFKKKANYAIRNAIDELLSDYTNLLEEYDNDKNKVVNLVKNEFIKKFIDKHQHLFNDLK